MRLEGGQAVVSIQDNGIGMPAHMLPRVFDMFTQVDGHLERSQGGLGIGLSIVQRLVQMHGGSVQARSDGLGKGSEFTVRLPLAQASVIDAPADRSAEQSANQAEPAARANASQRILVAEDNVDSAESLAMMLKMMGNETRMAHDGLQALDLAAAFKPDVVLLDIGMPKLNGFEVARRIRQQAWGQEADKRRSQEAGLDFHLVKPVFPADLERLLHEVTAGKAALSRAAD